MEYIIVEVEESPDDDFVYCEIFVHRGEFDKDELHQFLDNLIAQDVIQFYSIVPAEAFADPYPIKDLFTYALTNSLKASISPDGQ